MNDRGAKYDVTIILPVYNGEKWLEECLESIKIQEFSRTIQLSLFNDSSTDSTSFLIKKWKSILEGIGIDVVIGEDEKLAGPQGVGFAKNQAVSQSNGKYLCFLDADDVMNPLRISKQFTAAQSYPSNCLIGSKFHRLPEDSTVRYTKWANNITNEQLYSQIYTSHGPTIIMPTWFCSRAIFDRVGGFSEEKKGIPEDLIFFYEHLKLGGMLARVDEDLLMYRYHPEATTFSISEETIWTIRIKQFEKDILSKWNSFTIWNAGKQGKKFYRSLSENFKKNVLAFCDVDEKKIRHGVYTAYEGSKVLPKPQIPIIHFTQAKAPIVICVKQDMTKGDFEMNLASMNFKEGKDFYYFS